MQYIAYIWKHNDNSRAMLSRSEETLDEFKKRIQYVFPFSEGYHLQFFEIIKVV